MAHLKLDFSQIPIDLRVVVLINLRNKGAGLHLLEKLPI